MRVCVSDYAKVPRLDGVVVPCTCTREGIERLNTE